MGTASLEKHNIILDSEAGVEPISAITGGPDKRSMLIYQLRYSIAHAKGIDIIVSFLMESGVRLLLSDLRSAIQRGVPIRILTGSYLRITQPSALYLIKQELGDQVDMRFYNEVERSFHPKSYMFHYGDYSEVYIGSSNVSRSAFTSGIEWNYRFTTSLDRENYDVFHATFEDLLNNHSVVIDDEELARYSKSWHRPAVLKELLRTEDDEPSEVISIFQPRGAQIEALYALAKTREQGATRALVQAATGVGKTYLAAFDSSPYPRVLFVAHREEILRQAARSFRNVRKSDDYGFFCGDEKSTENSVIFASVASLGKSRYLSERYFPRDYFDYIVIDEFHHAVNQQYRNIVDYFMPKFLLGLTATPERMDGRDIYALCDYNVPFELSLRDAINKGMLVPFHYYGVYDETDYSGFRIVNGRYDEAELNNAYIGNVHRHNLIYKYYRKYQSRQALGFCCSRLHAEEMAAEFNRRGIASAAVYSDAQGEYAVNRRDAVARLRHGDLQVIFAVDMFNEGVDIDSLDMVMFLRPTESPVVFLQQLGRGLRRCRGKEFLNVLDFIGNYKKAGQAPILLSGEYRSGENSPHTETDIWNVVYPDGCQVDFDMRLVEVFHELAKRGQKKRDIIQGEYFRIKAELGGRIPTRMELFTGMGDDVYQLCLRTSKESPFKDYLRFLDESGELGSENSNVTQIERNMAAEAAGDYEYKAMPDTRINGVNVKLQQLYNGIGREFIHELETTAMTKVYKMAVLKAFYNDGKIKPALTEADLLSAWKALFASNGNWRDLPKCHSYGEYLEISDGTHLKNILSNPVHFLKKSCEFFVDGDGEHPIALRQDVCALLDNPELGEQLRDVIEYRTTEYYRSRYEGRNS